MVSSCNSRPRSSSSRLAQRPRSFQAAGNAKPAAAKSDEIADAVLFMMANPYLTGQVIDVDGGHTIRQYATH